MLLTLTTTAKPATDLGYLLHKNPGRVHEVGLSHGIARVFYPEATEARCTAALLLERLRARGLSAKRALALQEFALGVEALERFVRREPLRRTHEWAFGVLRLESEAVDPRL